MPAPQIVSYDPAWPSLAAQWCARIRGALTDAGLFDVVCEHIGSTAVPELDAKPFIDVQVLLPEVPSEQIIGAALAPWGFARTLGSRPDSPGVSFDIPRPGSDPRHHEKQLYVRSLENADGSAQGLILHVRRADSAFADFVRRFRDWLRADNDARAEYAALKRSLAAEFAGSADYDDYTRAKTAFMDRAQSAMGWPTAEGWPGARCTGT